MPGLPLTGGCLCEGVRYEVTEPPLFASYWSVDPDSRPPAGVRLGTFDSDPGVRPSFRTFTASATSWEPIVDDLPRYPEQRPPDA